MFKAANRERARENRVENRKPHSRKAHGSFDSFLAMSVNTFRFTQTRFHSVIEVDSSLACARFDRNSRGAAVSERTSVRFFSMGEPLVQKLHDSYTDCKAGTFVINTPSSTLLLHSSIRSSFIFSFLLHFLSPLLLRDSSASSSSSFFFSNGLFSFLFIPYLAGSFLFCIDYENKGKEDEIIMTQDGNKRHRGRGKSTIEWNVVKKLSAVSVLIPESIS